MPSCCEQRGGQGGCPRGGHTPFPAADTPNGILVRAVTRFSDAVVAIYAEVMDKLPVPVNRQ